MSNIFQKFKDLVGIEPINLEKELNEDEVPKKYTFFDKLRDFVGINEEFTEYDNYLSTQQQINKIEVDIQCLKHQLNVIENKIDVILAAIEQNRY